MLNPIQRPSFLAIPAAGDFAPTLEEPPQRPDQKLISSALTPITGIWCHATFFFNSRIETLPSSFSSTMQRTWNLIEMGDNNSAKLELRDASKLAASAKEWTKVGITYKRLGMILEAIECFTQAIEADHAYDYAYLRRALCFKIKNNIQASIDDFEKYVSLNTEDPIAWYHLAMLYQKVDPYKNTDRILECFAQSVRLPAQKAYMHYFEQGCFLDRLESYNKALEAINQALKYRSFPEAFQKRAGIRERLGMLAEAKRDYEEAIAGFAIPNFLCHFRLARICQKLNLPGEALREYNRCLEIDRTSGPKVGLFRADILYAQGLYTEALEAITPSIDPGGNIFPYFTRGLIYTQLGDIQKAIDGFTLIINRLDRKEKLNNSADYNLCLKAYQKRRDALLKLKEYSKADKDLERIKQLSKRY
ncbi:MAG: tetratricopeptide repeat protein [Deltaproteobacteria bacterium]|nr:MAG: tetratricopeptide repeat protein [Deltaproteobacteria bacterium]